jgi:hypothetical protein
MYIIVGGDDELAKEKRLPVEPGEPKGYGSPASESVHGPSAAFMTTYL